MFAIFCNHPQLNPRTCLLWRVIVKAPKIIYIYISSESPHYVIKSPTEIDSTLPIVTIYGEL